MHFLQIPASVTVAGAVVWFVLVTQWKVLNVPLLQVEAVIKDASFAEIHLLFDH
jgi:hypothetical protein